MYTVVVENKLSVPFVYASETYSEARMQAQKSMELFGITRISIFGPPDVAFANYQGVVEIFHGRG